MTKQPEFMKVFKQEHDALSRMRNKNRANRMSGWLWVVVEHPEGWAVVDVRTAIEMNASYRWDV